MTPTEKQATATLNHFGPQLLPDYQLRIRFEEHPEWPNCTASVEPMNFLKQAEIVVDPRNSPEEVPLVVLHELMHVVLNEIHCAGDHTIREFVPPSATRFIHENFERTFEPVCWLIGRVLLKNSGKFKEQK